MSENTNTNTSLSLNTIQNAINIIGVCCQRGVFRPEEMENVGKTYNQIRYIFIRCNAKNAKH